MRIADVPDPEDDFKADKPGGRRSALGVYTHNRWRGGRMPSDVFLSHPKFRSHRQHGRKEHSARSRNGDHKA